MAGTAPLVVTPLLEGGGREPPERKDGQRERSSGREVPVDDDGDK